MSKFRTIHIIFAASLLTACAVSDDDKTLASLRDVKIDVKEQEVEGSLDKAMQSYQRFLQETPESALTPDAIRRLADLKLEKEYGVVAQPDKEAREENKLEKPSPEPLGGKTRVGRKPGVQEVDPASTSSNESIKEFENRATRTGHLETKSSNEPVQLANGESVDLQTAGAMEAVTLYKKLLKKYPHYERNDQVLYQLSRAYEEIGQVEKAMEVMNQIIRKYPGTRYLDEVQFRRAEYYFTRKKYLAAEEAYQAVLKSGVGSEFYELALYKQGWSYFKQELYEDALNNFIKLLDYKVANGFDFNHIVSKTEKKHIDDTFRVISLSFSYLGGAPAVVEYFKKNGSRSFEVNVYSNLGEYYLDKRRYSDAASAYGSFVELNPFHKNAPHFQTRVIEIYKKGGFPKLVVEAKKEFAENYGLQADYWTQYDINKYQDIIDSLKTNLVDLANHYHALYQDRRFASSKAENSSEATYWYREFLKSFPDDSTAPEINYQLADLYLEKRDYQNAAKEYERTAYNYPEHKKSSKAGYAAVYAYREYVKSVPPSQKQIIKRETIRSSLKFVDTFYKHEKAPLIMAAAVDDLYEMKDYELAIKTGNKLLSIYPGSEEKIRYSAQLVVAHGSFDLMRYQDAEVAYLKVLKYNVPDTGSRADIIENLAASVYKQGEQANKLEDYNAAADHFLRIGRIAPTSKIRPTAEYDAAAALIRMKDWTRAAVVLEGFRKTYPQHKLRDDVTKKLAVIYKEAGKYLRAAAEFEKIEQIEKDPEIRREALYQAAELYEQARDTERALAVYKRYVQLFPRPLELVLETRQKIATVYKERGQSENYTKELRNIVRADANAGRERTDRTKYLAAMATLELNHPLLESYMSVKLTAPFKKNLLEKKNRMKKAIEGYTNLVDYGVGETTAAATYHIAEIYYHFSKALMGSERPDNLNELEKEQYELMLEEQAYPFEEKTITVHKKNLELLSRGVFNPWIDKSLDKLASLLPARFDKPEKSLAYVKQIRPYRIIDGVRSVDTKTLADSGAKAEVP